MGKFVTGLVPYGYRIDRDAFGGLSVCEEEAEIVRQVFSWYVEDRLPGDQIVRELNKMGVKTN
jgi:hypothetical protein